MGHIEGEAREQLALFPTSLDQAVSGDHPVRVIDAFVDTLDLAALGFGKAQAAATGRPAFHPGDLLKLYVYGYLNQIRSSRRLAREAKRNIEVLWLIGRLSPSFKTIAALRQDHPAAIVAVCRAFVVFCRGQKLYGGVLLAIDGSKIEAVASPKAVITPKMVSKRLAGLDRTIAAYLTTMDAADRAEAPVPTDRPADVAAALETLRQRRAAVQSQADHLAREALSQTVLTEPDAKLMRTARQGRCVAYNAQTAVDGQHGLIAAFDLVADGNDQTQLEPMALQGQAALAVETVTVVADAGYSNGRHGETCAKAGIVAAVPRPRTVNTTGEPLFSRTAFTYEAISDSWTCPAGQALVVANRSHTERNTRYAAKGACPACPLKTRCTRAEHRIVVRSFDEDARQAMHQRTLDDPTLMRRRRELAEHPFGIIKGMMGTRRFLVRGRLKAKAELALLVLGFNLKRTMTILGVPALLQALKPA